MTTTVPLSPTCMIERNPDLLQTEVDGEVIAMSVANGSCYGFNGVATAIWAMLETPQPLHAVLAQLEASYEVDHETCQRETMALIEQLSAEGLITISGD